MPIEKKLTRGKAHADSHHKQKQVRRQGSSRSRGLVQGACKAHRPQLQANMSLVRSSDRGPAVQRAFGIYLCDCRHQAAAKQVDKGQDWLCCAPGRIPKCIRRQHALSGHDRANPAIVSRTGSHTEGYGQSSRRQSARDAAATSLCSVVSFESTSSP